MSFRPTPSTGAEGGVPPFPNRLHAVLALGMKCNQAARVGAPPAGQLSDEDASKDASKEPKLEFILVRLNDAEMEGLFSDGLSYHGIDYLKAYQGRYVKTTEYEIVERFDITSTIGDNSVQEVIYSFYPKWNNQPQNVALGIKLLDLGYKLQYWKRPILQFVNVSYSNGYANMNSDALLYEEHIYVSTINGDVMPFEYTILSQRTVTTSGDSDVQRVIDSFYPDWPRMKENIPLATELTRLAYTFKYNLQS